MRPLSASELLAVWEQAYGKPLPQRGLALLAVACPEYSKEALSNLSIGRRDALLLELREWLFGSQIVMLANCPDCGDRLELTFDTSDLCVNPRDQAMEVIAMDEEVLSLSLAEHEVRFRLPNSQDHVEAAGRADLESALQYLLQRCLLGVYRHGQEMVADSLPDEVIQAVLERMEQADPQANVQLELLCPACSHTWQAAFDIVSFLWREINAWSVRVLRDIHTLASAYGWSEADILAMSPMRRQAYLELISQ